MHIEVMLISQTSEQQQYACSFLTTAKDSYFCCIIKKLLSEMHSSKEIAVCNSFFLDVQFLTFVTERILSELRKDNILWEPSDEARVLSILHNRVNKAIDFLVSIHMINRFDDSGDCILEWMGYYGIVTCIQSTAPTEEIVVVIGVFLVQVTDLNNKNCGDILFDGCGQSKCFQETFSKSSNESNKQPSEKYSSIVIATDISSELFCEVASDHHALYLESLSPFHIYRDCNIKNSPVSSTLAKKCFVWYMKFARYINCGYFAKNYCIIRSAV